MKKRWIWLPVALVLLLPQAGYGQIETNLSTYTGKNAEGYLSPLHEALGAGLNNGMFRSAQIPTSRIQFNLEIKLMAVKFGDGERTFRAETEEGFYPLTSVEAPTVVGSTEAMAVAGQSNTVAIFPGGFDISSLTLAVPQVTIGGFRGTQAIVRYLAFKTGDAEIGDFSLFGIGARHSISQYWEDAPVDLAAGFLYQSLGLGDKLIDTSALTVGVQASRRFYTVLEPYAGLSFDRFGMSVDYEYKDTDPPVRLDLDYDPTSNLRLTAGLGLNVSLVHLQGEVNLAGQTSFLVGLSLGN
jgi:hypothetical protein